MCRLNYTDLLALVVEYDIDEILAHFRKMESQRNEKRGVSVRDATNSEILRK